MPIAVTVRNEADLGSIDRTEDARRRTVGHSRSGATETIGDDGRRACSHDILVCRGKEGSRTIAR